MSPSTLQFNAMLADRADAVNGKLYIHGGGWSRIPAGLPFGIAMWAKVPWDQTNVEHPLKLELVDSDGQSVDDIPVFHHVIAVPRPLGVKPGTPIDWCGSMFIVPPPLPVGRYEFRFSIRDECLDDWRLPFDVIDPSQGMQQAA